MKFDVDYIEDLELVVIHFRRLRLVNEIEEIEEAKLAGSTGGEILDRICFVLRKVRSELADTEASEAISGYLTKARRGLF